MPPTLTVIDVIENALESSLDADLIASIPRLRVEQLRTIESAYRTLGETVPVCEPELGEFWPVNWNLIGNSWSDRSPRFAEDGLRRAVSQLLYSHGAFFVDELGRLLAEATHSKYQGGKDPMWKTSDIPSVEIANYLEALAYLRPLIDAGILVAIPRPVRETHRHELYTTFETSGFIQSAQLFAIEVVRGVAEREEYERKLAAGGSFSDSAAAKYDYNREMAFTWAFSSLLQKFMSSRLGLPGELNLESANEVEAFEWLAANARPVQAMHPESDKLVTLEGLIVPSLEQVEPRDVAAMHASEWWFEYRAALRSALERVQTIPSTSLEESLALIREELRSVEDAAKRTTRRSQFASKVRAAGRDVIIGAAVATGAVPVVGVEAALAGLATATARSGLDVVYSWLGVRVEKTEAAPTRVFGAFGQPRRG